MMFIVQENYVIENTRLTSVFKLAPVEGEWCWMIGIFLPEQKIFILDGFCEEKIPSQSTKVLKYYRTNVLKKHVQNRWTLKNVFKLAPVVGEWC